MTAYNREAGLKGGHGESLFRQLLNDTNAPYLPIDSRPGLMPSYFRAQGATRPDALVASYNDAYLVDVKNKQLEAFPYPHFTLDKGGADALLKTQQALNRPVLLVYRNNSDRDSDWYAIALDDALYSPRSRLVKGRHGFFYSIPITEFAPLQAYVPMQSDVAPNPQSEERPTAEQLQKSLFN